MAKPVDLELKKAFFELQVKMVEASKEIKDIDAKLAVLTRYLQHAGITQREISTLPSDTKTYESVGRMFLLTDLDTVKTNLKNKETQLTTRAQELESTKHYLEKNLKESEDNIREMVQQRKGQSDSKAN
ncbi:prefoldin subunit 1-like [Plodia interpunctella]|uniref:prefoldin subunit 1-like n=1 Tax=Plodia interpunctella TaxID=58824 RepID=UPI002367AA42|nr:prefoldin subunit 1-like [Plodia interpunctella]